MQNWSKIFRINRNVARLNANLAGSLARCPTLDAGGWNFRCVECHVATGTYPSGFEARWHSHAEYQIEIAVSGVFEFNTTKSKTIIIKPGRAVVIPWKMAHRWKCIKSGVMVGVSLELLPTPMSIQRNGWLIEDIRYVSNAPIRLKVDDMIKAALDDGDRSIHSKVTACRLFLVLAEIMEELFPSRETERHEPTKIAAETRGRETVGRVVRHLDEHLEANINLTEIAREVGMSGRHVHRLFLKHVGKSLHDYLLERRLERARTLLTEHGSKMHIKEIAFSCGFNSLAYFSNSFRKVYGVAPSSLLLAEVSLKSGATLKFHGSPVEASGPAAERKRAVTSAASK